VEKRVNTSDEHSERQASDEAAYHQVERERATHVTGLVVTSLT
jgi:hypothetical protein